MSDEPRLPFRVLDSVLGRMKSVVNAGADTAKAAIGAKAADAVEQTQIAAAPPPSATQTSSGALATELDEQARAALARPAKGKAKTSVVNRIKTADADDRRPGSDPSGRVLPDEELGPQPFTPQVGP